MIDRQFVRLAEGLVHIRHMDAVEGQPSSSPPFWMLHASPSSSRVLEPLMRALRDAGCGQALVAPDTLGNGDSAKPAPDDPDMAYFADSIARLLDAAGQDRIDIYGAHTGARIACEFAVRHPTRVRRVVLDGITEYADALKQQILDNYAPDIRPDEYGRQFVWAFNFVRDQWLHFPYFMRDPAHRLTRGVPSPEQLHLSALDVLKALGSYQKPYLAAFRYETRARLQAIAAQTLFLRPEGELPSLNAVAKELAASMKNAAVAVTGDGDKGKAAAIASFLNGAE
jgi:pimeloyl-ACP methyl ester carboxylesterase